MSQSNSSHNCRGRGSFRAISFLLPQPTARARSAQDSLDPTGRSKRVSLSLEPQFSSTIRKNMAEIAVEATEVPAQLPHIRVAVLGAGKMGGILLQAFLKENLFAPEKIHGTVQHAERALALSTQWGVDVGTDNRKAVEQADLILIGVKPFQVTSLMEEIKPALTKDKTIVSFAASVKTSAIEDAAGVELAV